METASFQSPHGSVVVLSHCCCCTTWFFFRFFRFCFYRNAAIFPVDNPDIPPLVADATIVVVNDARHQLEANFLQRTVPYFFELTGGLPTVASGGRYRWAKVAFVQTPQRFRMELSNDPLGNHAISQVSSEGYFSIIIANPQPFPRGELLATIPCIMMPYCRSV